MTDGVCLGIDFGEQRVGLALGNTSVRIAAPYKTLPNTPSLLQDLSAVIEAEQVAAAVVGLPRGLDGQETAQTARTRDFIATLDVLQVPVYTQDEAATSARAREELAIRKPGYTKEEVDALAAAYILQDYLDNL